MAAAEMYLDMFPRTRVTRKLSVSAVIQTVPQNIPDHRTTDLLLPLP